MATGNKVKLHHYDECPLCMMGYICEDSTANVVFEETRIEKWWKRVFRWPR